MTDLNELKAELQWSLENGMYGPRTGLLLMAVREFIEELEREGESA